MPSSKRTQSLPCAEARSEFQSHRLAADHKNIMERESLEMDVVFVGAGPANLSGAFHLARLIAEHNERAKGEGERGKGGKQKAEGSRQETAKTLGEIQIAVIEKGASVGAHILSGAVMDP